VRREEGKEEKVKTSKDDQGSTLDESKWYKMFLLLQALVAFLLVALGEAAHLETLSFEPPFNEVDSGGVRMVKNWKSAGSTMVSQNFVRLTPDRQSKKGSLWSRRPLGVDSFSAILKFRISGQAKTFFGDGVALWITNHSYYTEGDLHGCAEKFLGIGSESYSSFFV